MPFAAVVAIAVVVALVVLTGLFKAMWRIAEPNEALIISGARHRAEGVGESMGFRIVTGHGTLVIPGIQSVRRLSLDLNETDLVVDCVTKQGIPVHVRGVTIFKVGDDFASIANAARRFLDQQEQMPQRVQNVFAGHLRSIIGSLTVEELIRERERLTQETRAAAGTEMEKLGLIIDTLQVQEIDDPTGYIGNLAKPHAAAVQRDARIAAAAADREATTAEAEAQARKAEAVRTSAIAQAQYQAEVNEARAKSDQAGPLADAAARQQVVVEETRVAELEAARREQQLQADVRKPADAKAYEQRTLAEASRDARISAAQAQARETELAATASARRTEVEAEAQAKATQLHAQAEARATEVNGVAAAKAIAAKGEAEGAAVLARGLAEAEAIAKRGEALAQHSEAVVLQQLAENYPAIVGAASQAFRNVGSMTVLNGTDGVVEGLTSVIGQGMAGLGALRQLLPTQRTDATARTEGSAS